MTQILARRPETATAARTVLSLHGTDETGVATWHVTPLADDGAPDTYLIERAPGDISNPAVWMQTQREARTVGEDEVIELVRQVLFRPAGGR